MAENNRMEESDNEQSAAATFAGPSMKAKPLNGSSAMFNKIMNHLKRHLADDNIDLTPEMQEIINKVTTFGQKNKDGSWTANTEKRKTIPIEYRVLSADELDRVKENGLDARLEDLISCVKQNAKFLYESEYMSTMVEFILKFKSNTTIINNASGDGDPNITCRDFTYETNLLSKELKIKMTKVKIPFVWAMIQVVWELTRSMPDILSFIEGNSVWNKIEFLVNSQLIHRPEDAVEVSRFDSRFNRKNLKIIYSKNKIEQLIRLADLEKSVPRITKRTREGGEEGLGLYASVKRMKLDGKQEEEEDVKLMSITRTGYQPQKITVNIGEDDAKGNVIVLCSPRSGLFMEKTKPRKVDQLANNRLVIDEGYEDNGTNNMTSDDDYDDDTIEEKKNIVKNDDSSTNDVNSGDDDENEVEED